jgi:hypothetical protein
MTTIADAFIQELMNSGGQCTGVGDLFERISGDRHAKLNAFRKLEKRLILVRSPKNTKYGRGHKRTVRLLRES